MPPNKLRDDDGGHASGDASPAGQEDSSVIRRRSPLLEVNERVFQRGEDTEIPSSADVYSTIKGTDLCKREEWMRQHKEVAQKARPMTIYPTTSAAVKKGRKGPDHALNQLKQRFPSLRESSCEIMADDSFRFTTSTDELSRRWVVFHVGTHGRALCVQHRVELGWTFRGVLDRVPDELVGIPAISLDSLFLNAVAVIFHWHELPLQILTICRPSSLGISADLTIESVHTNWSSEHDTPSKFPGISLNCDQIDPDVDIPPSPLYATNSPEDLLKSVNDARKKKDFAETSNQQLHRGVAALQWAYSAVATMSGSRTERERFANHLLESLAPRSFLRPSRAPMSTIYQTHEDPTGISLSPQAWVSNIWPGAPGLQMRLPNMSQATVRMAQKRIRGRAQETWFATGSALEAMMDACRLADAIKQLGSAILKEKCLCGEEEAKSTPHHCDTCLDLFMCNELVAPHSGSRLRLCTICLAKVHHNGGQAPVAPPTAPAPPPQPTTSYPSAEPKGKLSSEKSDADEEPKSHASTHTQQQNVICKTCRKQFGNKSQLAKHIEQTHPTPLSAQTTSVKRTTAERPGTSFSTTPPPTKKMPSAATLRTGAKSLIAKMKLPRRSLASIGWEGAEKAGDRDGSGRKEQPETGVTSDLASPSGWANDDYRQGLQDLESAHRDFRDEQRKDLQEIIDMARTAQQTLDTAQQTLDTARQMSRTVRLKAQQMLETVQ